MEIITHVIANTKIAEISSEKILIKSAEDGLEILSIVYYEDFDNVIIHERNIIPDFFDLQNGIAGEILQKFSNYRVRLAIVGDFGKYTRKSIRGFIYESNRNGQIHFVDSIPEALQKLSKPI